MKRPMLGVLVALVVSLQASVSAQLRYPYLVEATNRLLAVNADPKATSADLVAATTQACQALEELLKEKQFATDLQQWKNNPSAKERGEFKRDIAQFLYAFLPPEADVLQRAGLNGPARTTALRAAATTQASIDGKIDPAEILANVNKLRDQVCAVAKRMAGNMREEDARREAQRIGVGIVGVVMVVADAPILAANPILAALSTAAGGVMISNILPK